MATETTVSGYLEANRRICSGLRRAGLSLLMVSVAATLGTAPFMLYHFNRLSLVGPLMNLAIDAVDRKSVV